MLPASSLLWLISVGAGRIRAISWALRVKALETAPLGIALPIGGVTGADLLHEMSLGENPVHSWTSVVGTFGVASSLEASLLEIGLNFAVCIANGGGRRPWVDVSRWVVVARFWLGSEVLRDHGCCWLQVSVCGVVAFLVVACLFFEPRRHNKSGRSSVQQQSVASRWLLLCHEEVDAVRPPCV